MQALKQCLIVQCASATQHEAQPDERPTTSHTHLRIASSPDTMPLIMQPWMSGFIVFFARRTAATSAALPHHPRGSVRAVTLTLALLAEAPRTRNSYFVSGSKSVMLKCVARPA